ncbi:mammalian cell entry protein [Mycolicibacterium komossense]|uniref:Mammalian cell entry protein n=1 Tax=Mycolicibacterium komossense TaxID=1779 RepID=A0ABT3C8F8_9MYCO|nr:mammalian cell entry protein [Mycolicibacterium komossense]MCV7225726.1 mammalian cell entry protein [Mycolicibacterium komossense]
MEDQQSAAGDLTGSAESVEVPESAEVPEETDSARRRHRMPVGKARRQSAPASLAEDAEPAEPGPEEPEPAEAEPEPAENEGAETDIEPPTAADDATGRVVFVERKPPGGRAPIAIAVAVALFIGAGAFAGAMLQPYLADRALVDTKLNIARTAADAITTLWTYTPDNMEALADRSARFLGGDFEAQYRKYVDAIVPTNKQAQVTNTTQVVGAAVESLSGSDATAIVFTNTTSTSPLTKNIPSMRYLSYRLTLTRDNAQWLVTKMTTITSLDLTPQL